MAIIKGLGLLIYILLGFLGAVGFNSGIRVLGLGGLGFWGLGLWGFGFRNWGLEFRVKGFKNCIRNLEPQHWHLSFSGLLLRNLK